METQGAFFWFFPKKYFKGMLKIGFIGIKMLNSLSWNFNTRDLIIK